MKGVGCQALERGSRPDLDSMTVVHTSNMHLVHGNEYLTNLGRSMRLTAGHE
jgi:hypothetical protein